MLIGDNYFVVTFIRRR